MLRVDTCKKGRGFDLFFFLGKQTLQLLAGASCSVSRSVGFDYGLKFVIFFMVDAILSCSTGTPNNQFEMDVFVKPTIFSLRNDLRHDPIETTIYIWLKNPGTVGKWTINNSSLWKESLFNLHYHCYSTWAAPNQWCTPRKIDMDTQVMMGLGTGGTPA